MLRSQDRLIFIKGIPVPGKISILKHVYPLGSLNLRDLYACILIKFTEAIHHTNHHTYSRIIQQQRRLLQISSLKHIKVWCLSYVSMTWIMICRALSPVRHHNIACTDAAVLTVGPFHSTITCKISTNTSVSLVISTLSVFARRHITKYHYQEYCFILRYCFTWQQHADNIDPFQSVQNHTARLIIFFLISPLAGLTLLNVWMCMQSARGGILLLRR